MIFARVLIVFSFISANMVATFAKPQRMPDPLGDSAKWFEQIASSVNKDFKPTFQDQPNLQFQDQANAQSQQDPAAQASAQSPAQDTQPQAAQDGFKPEIDFFNPEEVARYILNPGFIFGPCLSYPCPSPDQPKADSQAQQTGTQQQPNTGFQASSEFQPKPETVSQEQQNVDPQAQQNGAQTNPGTQDQQTFQHQGTSGFQNPFQSNMNFFNNFLKYF